jgi:hypothetical protein
MKKRLFIYTSIALAAISCNKFEEINTDAFGVTPEMGKMDGATIGGKITAMQTQVFPVGTQADGTNVINQYQTAYHLAADTWSGYFAQNQDWNGGNNNTTYFLLEGWYESSYDNSYTKVIPLWSSIKADAEKSNFPEAFALAQILKISAWHKATDMFGPIPYKQAGKGLLRVPYDSQEEVYQAFFDDLTAAIAVLQAKYDQGGALLPNYDAVYAGDVGKWIKYANSLMLRLAMRIRYAAPTKAQQYAEQAINQTLGVMTDKADEAKMREGAGLSFVNNIETFANQYGECRMGSSMFSYLVGYEDPRLMKYFKPSDSRYAQNVPFAGAKYQALPTGAGWKTTYFKSFSMPNIEKTTPTYWMRASEVYFLRAEGALMGWNMGDTAENLYIKGVETSFAENDINAGQVAPYLTSGKEPADYYASWLGNANAPTQATTKWQGTTEEKLEKIITQKWIALYPNGQEAWTEWRRTGYPKLHKVTQNASGGVISSEKGVRRIPYPESKLTGEDRAYLARALQLLGGANTGATKVWWDKKN